MNCKYYLGIFVILFIKRTTCRRKRFCYKIERDSFYYFKSLVSRNLVLQYFSNLRKHLI